jgi:hypothetical protein
MAQPAPFSRLQVPDQPTNAAIQDIYNKLAQIQQALSLLQELLKKHGIV